MIEIFDPVVKCSGSKRSQCHKIVEYIPDRINTYYETFVGGASVLRALLQSNKEIDHFECSDVNIDLIHLWQDIKNNPQKLIDGYQYRWDLLNQDDDTVRKKDYFNYVRQRLNIYHTTEDFLFILRTATNGMIRYNKKGEFNNSFHVTRNGIHPDRLEKIIFEWSDLLYSNEVEFKCRSYEQVQSAENDFMYLDPPYPSTNTMYYGLIDYNYMWNWLYNQKGGYALSFTVDHVHKVPEWVYDDYVQIRSGCSSFRRLRTRSKINVDEGLYINA